MVCALIASERASLARQRAPQARHSLANCHLCAHACGVNRLAGEVGLCRAGALSRIFCAQVEAGDELEFVPTFAMAFSGCDLRCGFCITRASSWHPQAGWPLDLANVARQAEQAVARGARTFMILGGEPTIHLPNVLDLVALLPNEVPLIWKTNAHASATAREWMDGVFDVWLADYKFGNDACALRLSGEGHYLSIIQENLRWARAHSELVVRHLLLPGHVACCWEPLAAWLAAELPGVKTSLRTAFWPAPLAAQPELRRAVTPSEAARAREIALACHLNLIP